MNTSFLQKVLHRIFTLFLSLAGAFTLVFFIRNALPEGYVKPLGITLIFIAGLDIISIIAHDLFVSEKATGFTYLRYAIYLNIILALIIKFCKPIVSTGLIWAGTNFAVILTYLIKRMFDLYESFTEHTFGMDGKQLSSDLVENNWYVSDYINYAKKLIFALCVIIFVLTACVLILYILKIKISVSLYISLICFIAGYVGLIILHTVNDHETSFAFLGHAAIFNFRKSIVALCVMLCLVSVGAGSILSSDTPLLRPEYFKWMLKGFPQDVNAGAYIGYGQSSLQADEEIDMKDMGNLREDSKISQIMHKFFIILEYVAVAVVAIGIIIFMTNAFFGKKWKDFWKGRKLSKLFRAVWKKLKQLIHDLLHTKRHKIAYNTVEAASFRDTMKSLLSGARKSKEKRAELDALTKKFMRLVDFAASQGVSYKPHMAPLEFCAAFAEQCGLKAESMPRSDNDTQQAAPHSHIIPSTGSAAFAEQCGLKAESMPRSDNDTQQDSDASRVSAALTAGRLFEQALYAKELLTKEERTQFEESVAIACR